MQNSWSLTINLKLAVSVLHSWCCKVGIVGYSLWWFSIAKVMPESSWRIEFKIRVGCLLQFSLFVPNAFMLLPPPHTHHLSLFPTNLPSLGDVLSVCGHSCLSCVLPARLLLLGCLLLSLFVCLVIILLIYLKKLCLVMPSQYYEILLLVALIFRFKTNQQ